MEYKQRLYEGEYILSLNKLVKDDKLPELPDKPEFHEKLKSLRQEAEAAYKREKYEYRLYIDEKLVKSSWDRLGKINY